MTYLNIQVSCNITQESEKSRGSTYKECKYSGKNKELATSEDATADDWNYVHSLVSISGKISILLTDPVNASLRGPREPEKPNCH